MYVCVLQNRNRSTPLDLKSKELESTLLNKVGTGIASVQESTRITSLTGLAGKYNWLLRQ